MPESAAVLMKQLHDEHAAALWGYCLSLTGRDHARAEDVVQETLLRAWRNRDRLEESRGSVRSWLFTVDYKRIGILYLVSISAFFVLGGFFAALIRTNLLTPTGTILTEDQ